MRRARVSWYAAFFLLIPLIASGCGDENGVAPKKVPRFDSPRITFDEGGGGNPYVPHIPIYNPTTGETDSLPVLVANGPYGPAISPDGTRIAFARIQSDVWRGRQIVTMAIDGTGLRACTADSGYHDGTPRWSPDGKHIAFTRWNYMTGPVDVFVVGTDGTGLRNLTQQGLSLVLDWSPDGSHVLVQQGQSGVFKVGTIPAAGGAFEPILNAQVRDADYSPDGTRIAGIQTRPDYQFLSQRGNRLFVMNADGANVETLVDSTQVGYSFGCSWYPDGQSIVISATGSIQSTRWQLMVYRFGQADAEFLFPNDTISRENPNCGPKP